MHTRITLDIDLDPTLWAEYEGVTPDEVRQDVARYLSGITAATFPAIAAADGTVTIR